MKKLLLLTILIFLTGCSQKFGASLLPQKIPVDLKLESVKGKILDAKDVDWIIEKEDGTIENKGKIKSYDYIGDEITDSIKKEKIIFRKNKSFSNEVLVKKEIGEKITTTTEKFFVANNLFYKDKDDKVYKIIKGATTTIEQWDKQIKKASLLDRLLGINLVYADTTTNYYSGIGDGYAKIDGSNWSTSHSASSGNSSNYTGINNLQGKVRRDGSDADFQISRTFIPVDTSGLPDTTTITSASLWMYINFATDSFNDSYGYVSIIAATTQASTASVSNSDFNQCGAATNPTEAIDTGDRLDITYADSHEKSWYEFPFNSTGISNISLTGYTKLGLREGHDIQNVTPGSGTYRSSEVWFYSADDATTPNLSPYIEITYTTSGGTPARKKAQPINFNIY